MVITVDSSIGCTAARLDGVLLTGFSVVDATHVTGRVPVHALGATDLVVYKGALASSPLVGAFTYVDFTSRLGIPRSRLGNIRLGTGI